MSINGEKKKSQRDTSNVIAKYELYGSRQSYFTQKMHAAMEWYFQHDYELILNQETLDIFNFIIERDPLPEELDTPTMQALRDYAAKERLRWVDDESID